MSKIIESILISSCENNDLNTIKLLGIYKKELFNNIIYFKLSNLDTKKWFFANKIYTDKNISENLMELMEYSSRKYHDEVKWYIELIANKKITFNINTINNAFSTACQSNKYKIAKLIYEEFYKTKGFDYSLNDNLYICVQNAYYIIFKWLLFIDNKKLFTINDDIILLICCNGDYYMLKDIETIIEYDKINIPNIINKYINIHGHDPSVEIRYNSDKKALEILNWLKLKMLK